MSDLSVMFSRTLCFFLRIRNCRYYNVRKFLFKGKFRGSDENVKSTDSRKSGKRMGFKDKYALSPKTIRYDSEKIKIGKLYASLHNAIIESVIEKSWEAERFFQKHLKNYNTVEDIGDVIRKRLDIHSVSHLDHFKKLELARSQEQKDNVKEHLDQNRLALFRAHGDNNKVCTNKRRQVEIETKNKIDMLQNSKRIISAMANSQASTMSDKLAKSDCVNYFKWNRSFFQDKKNKNQRASNKSENYEKNDFSIQSDTSNKKNVMSSENSKSEIQLQDDAGIMEMTDRKIRYSHEENKKIDQCIDNNKSIKTDHSLKDDKICLVANFHEKLPSFEDDIKKVIEKPTLENSPDMKQKDNINQNKELYVEPVSSLNLNHDNKQLNTGNHSDQNNTENIVETLRNENNYQASQSFASKPTSKNIDAHKESMKRLQESLLNSSKHLSDLMEFVSSSNNQFLDLQNKLELFGLHEEAKNLRVFSKSINQSLEQTILDDVSLYLLGVQKSILTYCNDNTGEESTGVPNIKATTGNILSVLDTYLEKPETIEKEFKSKLDHDCVPCNDSTLNTNGDSFFKPPNEDKFHQERECSTKEELSRSEEGNKTKTSYSIDIEKNNLDIFNIQHNGREENNIEEEFTKCSVNDSAEDKYELVINNNSDDYLSNEESEFAERNDRSLFDVDESGQILYNYTKEKPVLKYKNDLVRRLQQSTIQSISTSNADRNRLGIDSLTGDHKSDFSTKSEKINNSLLSIKQCGDSIIDGTSKSSGESESDYQRKTPNSDSVRASKLQNKKNLKAKTFLHSNYWKNHANSYHTISRNIPWVIGKKCLIETSEVGWKSQNNNVLITTEQSIEIEDSKDSNNYYSTECVENLHRKLRKNVDIGNQSVRSFNTSSKAQKFLKVGDGKYELKLLENITDKRNYSIDHDKAFRNQRVLREKKKLSVRELFPEKKKPPIQTEKPQTENNKEDIKLEVIGKKIVLQDPPVEEGIIHEEVLVEAAEKFLPSKSKYGIGISDSKELEKQTQASDVSKQFHEITEEMILDGFGLTTVSNSIYEDSKNSAGISVSEPFNASEERLESNYEFNSKMRKNYNETEADEESGEYDNKAPIGFMQSQPNTPLERSRGNSRNFPANKQRINYYEEI